MNDTYELEIGFSQNSELGICQTVPSAEHLELDLEATFRRSPQLFAYVQHLELPQLPDWRLSATLPIKDKVQNAMSVQVALWSLFREASRSEFCFIIERRVETH